MTKFKNKKLEDVVCVYNGKPGCMCGCNGVYSYATNHREYASKDRGYEVEENEINDRKVKMMFNKFLKNIDQVKCNDGNQEDITSYIYFIETETKNNVIYFKK
jgi:hypothetical protein